MSHKDDETLHHKGKAERTPLHLEVLLKLEVETRWLRNALSVDTHEHIEWTKHPWTFEPLDKKIMDRADRIRANTIKLRMLQVAIEVLSTEGVQGLVAWCLKPPKSIGATTTAAKQARKSVLSVVVSELEKALK